LKNLEVLLDEEKMMGMGTFKERKVDQAQRKKEEEA
jgi:hypothetical protein